MNEIKTAPPEAETPWTRLDRAFRTVIKVPKEALLKEEANEKREKERKRRKKKPS